MKTDALVAALSRELTPVDRRAPERALLLVLVFGTAWALLQMRMTLGLNPKLVAYLELPMFWVKFGFGAVLAAAALPLAFRLGRPGRQVPMAMPLTMGVPFLVLGVLAALALAAAEPQQRPQLMLGATFRTCVANITLLALPLLAAGLVAMKKWAPTRPIAAGAVTGLLAGGIATSVYALHCPELAAPFLAMWYGLGVLVSTGLGALLGARLLRW